MIVEFSGTERLGAERLTAAHLPEYRLLLQNPRVMATLSPDGRPLSDELVAEWLGYSVAHWEQLGFGYWLLRSKVSGGFVGRAGLRTTTIDGMDDIELGYAILPEFWNRGLATEFARALQVAFEQLGASRIVSYTLESNRASQRVMEKAGFRFEKRIEHAGLPHVFYNLSANEFALETH